MRTDQEQEWMSINIEGEDVNEAYLKWLRARVEMERGQGFEPQWGQICVFVKKKKNIEGKDSRAIGGVECFLIYHERVGFCREEETKLEPIDNDIIIDGAWSFLLSMCTFIIIIIITTTTIIIIIVFDE